MFIREIAGKCNLSIDTLRYYDKIGLLTPKRDNNVRYYTKADLEKLKTIIAMKKMKFSLKEIKKILDLDDLITKQIQAQAVNIDTCKQLLIETEKKLAFIIEQEKELKLIKKQMTNINLKIKKLIEGVKVE